MRKFLLNIIASSLVFTGLAQLKPPCDLNYGTDADETNIALQMRYGTILDAVNAINQAKNSRANSLGCSQSLYSYTPANPNEPLLSDLVRIWNSEHAPYISNFDISCPRIGRYESNSALGAYYAMLAGYYSDTSKLAEIADMMYDQQYASWNINSPDLRNEGVYGYINVPVTNPCYPGGVVGSSVSTVCSELPSYCVTYTGGQFSGSNFLISGQDDSHNWFDGGIAYDHGWIGVQMIESSIQQNDPLLKEKYRNSARLAAQYCISEYAVKNHNYTAKLIWLLAEMYAWTGEKLFANELNYKLNKNLIPGILWDSTNSGVVDGTSPPISFSTLTAVAQQPGRMWDGHNSLPWYHAMNTWALTEAYVAFRDQGDSTRASDLKPYVLGMVDNLANEILNKGIVSPDQLGIRDITYSLLIAIWKLSQYENEPHQNWESAAWAMWNTGYFNKYSTHSVCVGLYLLVQSQTTFVPLHQRENFALKTNKAASKNRLILFPNPANDILYLKRFNTNHSEYTIFSVAGIAIKKGGIDKGWINISSLNPGCYLIAIDERVIGRIIKK